MARRRDEHEARVAAVNALGKHLTRRAGSRCELCGSTHDLRVIEIPPVGEEPHESAAILACARCRALVASKPSRAGGSDLARDADELRFLDAAVWADPIPVKVAAIRLLRRLASEDVGWAREAVDGLWIPDDVAERL